MIHDTLHWFVNNSEGLVALLGIVGAIIALLVQAGWINKETGTTLARTIENGRDVGIRTMRQIRDLEAKKIQETEKSLGRKLSDDERAQCKLSDLEIAESFGKGLKGEAREQAIKTGVRSIVTAVTHRAMEADPAKVKPRLLGRIGNVIRSRIPGLGG